MLEPLLVGRAGRTDRGTDTQTGEAIPDLSPVPAQAEVFLFPSESQECGKLGSLTPACPIPSASDPVG